jgi:hypothetical protein
MLFVALGKLKPGVDPKEPMQRRVKWEYPEGSGVVAEYWLQTPDPSIVVVANADTVATLMAMTAAWEDLYDIRVVPAVGAEEGLEVAKQMMEE